MKQLPNPEKPLWHRTDIPMHERLISKEAYNCLLKGLGKPER